MNIEKLIAQEVVKELGQGVHIHISNEWVSMSLFSAITGISTSKIKQRIAAGLYEKRKDGKNVLINLRKYNSDLATGKLAD